jgi:hypothetical protein
MSHDLPPDAPAELFRPYLSECNERDGANVSCVTELRQLVGGWLREVVGWRIYIGNV